MPGDAVYGFALIAVASWIALIFVVVYRSSGSLSPSRPRRMHRGMYRAPSRFKKDRVRKEGAPHLTDAGQQLNAVMAASFEKQKLLSFPEYKVFKIIEDDIAAGRCGYRVFAQTSLGEILRSSDEEAFQSINCKRVDILIVDHRGWPALAVEYQGSGHYKGTAAARDAVKKEALRKAGVRYLDVSESDTAAQIRSRIREQLGCETA